MLSCSLDILEVVQMIQSTLDQRHSEKCSPAAFGPPTPQTVWSGKKIVKAFLMWACFMALFLGF